MASNRSALNLFFPELKHLIFKRKYIAVVDVTDKCNLRCNFCYHKRNISLEDNTTLEQWEERFKEYYKMGIRYVIFVGGEPSLRYDVLKLAENYFPFIETFTNGQIKIPKEFNHRLLLSIEGLEEEHDEICGRGTFKTAVDNYWGDKRVVVFSTLSKKNYNDPQKLREFIDFIREMNIQGIRFAPYIPKVEEDDSLFLTDNQRREVGEVLLKELKRQDSILVMPKGLINHIFYTSVPIKNPSYKRGSSEQRMCFFDSQNRKKRCVNNENDCSRCLAYYDPPLYRFTEWLSHKKILYKSFNSLNS